MKCLYRFCGVWPAARLIPAGGRVGLPSLLRKLEPIRMRARPRAGRRRSWLPCPHGGGGHAGPREAAMIQREGDKDGIAARGQQGGKLAATWLLRGGSRAAAGGGAGPYFK